MSVPAAVRPRPSAGTQPWLLAGLAAIALVSAAAAASPRLGIALAIVFVVGIALVRQPTLLVVILAGSLFIEAISLGGVNISRLLAPIAVAATLVALLRGERRLEPAPPLAWIGAYLLWALLSGFWTRSTGGTSFLLGSLAVALAYMTAFATFVETEEDLSRTLSLLGILSIPASLYAIADFAAVGGRSSGGVGDPNAFASVELIFLPLVLTAAVQTRTPRLRLLLFGAALADVGAAMTTLSRGGLITLVVLVAAVVLLPARALFSSAAQKLALLGVLLACAGLAFSVTSNVFTPRLHDIFTHSGQTGSGRTNLWRGALTSIREHPFVGIGYGAFPSQSVDLVDRTPGVDLVDWQPPAKGDFVHDAYLETFAELGIPGLVIFLAILGSTAALLVRSARLARRLGRPALARVANALLLSVVAWTIGAVFLSQETARPLWVVIGLSLALSALVRREIRRVGQFKPGS